MRKSLKTKILKYKPLKDQKGRYIPYCDFRSHKGISKTPEICEQRKCKNYYKLYILKEELD